jgi:hypothetical protein
MAASAVVHLFSFQKQEVIGNNTLNPKAHRARKARGLVAALDLGNFNSRSSEIGKQDRRYCRGIYLQKKSKLSR